jgi:transglutaminase-like putative cysteine protease
MQLDYSRPSMLGSLPPGAAGTRVTLQMMRNLVHEGRRSDRVRSTAISLTNTLAPKDWSGEVRALFAFVRDNIRYVRDIHDVETLQTAEATLDLEAGDCDDKAVLLSALLESIGHPTRFVAVGYFRRDHYEHVYVETRMGAGWIALDATMDVEAGWSPRPSVARMVIDN